MADSQQQQQEKEEQQEQKQEPKQEEQEQKQKDGNERKKTAKQPSRHNKLYRTPPTPDADVMFEREQTFVLDSRVVSSISEDYSRANPKVGSVLPPYNAQKDAHVRAYFKFSGVKDTLKNNKQEPPGTCIEGPPIERFFTSGHGMRYLTPRNGKNPDGKSQANGYSNEERMGHGKLWRHPNPRLAQFDRTAREFQGFSGRFGYRRTTPGLRLVPSPFGVNTTTPIY